MFGDYIADLFVNKFSLSDDLLEFKGHKVLLICLDQAAKVVFDLEINDNRVKQRPRTEDSFIKSNEFLYKHYHLDCLTQGLVFNFASNLADGTKNCLQVSLIGKNQGVKLDIFGRSKAGVEIIWFYSKLVVDSEVLSTCIDICFFIFLKELVDCVALVDLLSFIVEFDF